MQHAGVTDETALETSHKNTWRQITNNRSFIKVRRATWSLWKKSGLLMMACKGISDSKEQSLNAAHQNQLFLPFFSSLFSYLCIAALLIDFFPCRIFHFLFFGSHGCCMPSHTCWDLHWNGQWHFKVPQLGFKINIPRPDFTCLCSVCSQDWKTATATPSQSWKLEPFLFKLNLKLHVIQSVQATRNSLR